MAKLTNHEEMMLIQLLKQKEAERVSPKIEQLRSPIIGGSCGDDIIIRGARGGRAAGAKSSGVISLLVQESHISHQRVACLREVQNSLEESVHQLVRETIEKLDYTGWKVTDRSIDSPTGSHWIFRGVKDSTAQSNVKGLQGFTRFFADEAANFSESSWRVLLPTLFRNKGSQLWFAYNPESEYDPVTINVWNMFFNDPCSKLIECLPCEIDNPWFSESLQKISNVMKREDPDLWEHVYGGKPLAQGDNSVMSRVAIREAAEREILNPVGVIEIGCDVARFGDDKTVIYKRHGLKVIEKRKYSGQDTVRTARECWDMANKDPSILIKVDDTGVGGGVTDMLRDWGAKVAAVNNNQKPMDNQKYTTAADEMWFEFPVDQADIPDDPETMRQLEARQYDYERGTLRKKIESKKEYKKRLLKSPDDADALLLCFYQPARDIGINLRDQMKARRKMGR